MSGITASTPDSSTSDQAASRSPWPWIMLALWSLWLAGMILLSWPELGRMRIPHEAVNVIKN